MIAYVFWHWPDAGAERDAYEAAQREFHQKLGEAPSEGFQRSTSFRVHGVPWIAGGEGYEDWYLLDGSYALDPLNELAVSPAVRGVHDAAARSAAGAGGLYRLVRGVPRLAAGRVLWVAKRRGDPYDGFYARFGPDTVIWRRQMVLGPAREFLIEGEAPEGLDAIGVERETY